MADGEALDAQALLMAGGCITLRRDGTRIITAVSPFAEESKLRPAEVVLPALGLHRLEAEVLLPYNRTEVLLVGESLERQGEKVPGICIKRCRSGQGSAWGETIAEAIERLTDGAIRMSATKKAVEPVGHEI